MSAQSGDHQELRALFRDVIANPTDPATNFLYARKAEELGERRKALAAYERVLAQDPDNEEARAEYTRLKLAVRPPFTHWLASIGAQWNSNALLQSDRDGGAEADTNGVGVLRMQDERAVGERKVASDVFVFGSLYSRFSENNIAYGSVKSGPIFGLPNGASLTTQGSFEGAYLDGDFLFVAAGLEATYDPEDPDSTLTGVSVGASYANFGEDFPDRDGLVLNMAAGFQWNDVGRDGAVLQFRPGYVFNGASGANNRNRFHELGARVSWLTALTTDFAGFQTIFGMVELEAKTRIYVGHAFTEDGPRRDLRVKPGLRVIGSQFQGEDITLTANYGYENNASTDSRQIFDNHQVGLTLTIGF